MTTDQLPEIYPDYTEVTIPTDIAPLNFAMTDDEVTTMDVRVKGVKGGELHTNGAFADFDIDEWHQLLEQNKGGKLTVSVNAEKDGQWTAYRDFSIYVSNYLPFSSIADDIFFQLGVSKPSKIGSLLLVPSPFHEP